MILNLEFKNYRSFKGICSFTTEPTSSKAKVENLCEVETNAEGNKKVLRISLIFGANAGKVVGMRRAVDGPNGRDDGRKLLLMLR